MEHTHAHEYIQGADLFLMVERPDGRVGHALTEIALRHTLLTDMMPQPASGFKGVTDSDHFSRKSCSAGPIWMVWTSIPGVVLLLWLRRL